MLKLTGAQHIHTQMCIQVRLEESRITFPAPECILPSALKFSFMDPNVTLEVVLSDGAVLAVGTHEGPLPRVGEQMAFQSRGVHCGVAAVGALMNLPSGGGPPNPAKRCSTKPRLHLWATRLF